MVGAMKHTQLNAKEREQLAQELINAANTINCVALKAESLLLDSGYEQTPEAIAEIDDATNYPAIAELAVAFRAIAMRLDRAALAKS